MLLGPVCIVKLTGALSSFYDDDDDDDDDDDVGHILVIGYLHAVR